MEDDRIDENQDVSIKLKVNRFYSSNIEDNEKQKSEMTFSTIPNKKTTTGLNTTETANVNILVVRKDLPYPDLDEIPEKKNKK